MYTTTHKFAGVALAAIVAVASINLQHAMAMPTTSLKATPQTAT